jgi:NADPH:quinone reductase-like Zn-dependent oxidoreductase
MGGNMANPILVTGAAGRVGAIGRTVTELLMKHGKAVRAMVRTEDERAQALRDMGAEVVVGDLLVLDSLQGNCRLRDDVLRHVDLGRLSGRDG